MENRRRDRIAAVVLAAGTSGRMGEPKQLLRLGERTVLEQTLLNLRSTQISEVVLVLGFTAEVIARQADHHKVKIVINEQFREGMASSLRAGLAALGPEIDAALIVLADQPFVRPATFDQIIERYAESRAQVALPTYRGFRGNPVILDRSVFVEVMALTGDIGCRAIFGDHPEGIVKVPVDDIGILLDIDNQNDYERLRGFATGETIPTSVIEAADLSGRETAGPAGPSRVKGDLVLVGAEQVVFALARLGKQMGLRVTVVDPLLTIADLPDADFVLNALDFSQLPGGTRYVVVASRGRFDEEAIEQALQAEVFYLGLVANKRRAQEIFRALAFKGHPAAKLRTIHAPAGLDSNAESAQEIALSIMSEIILEKNKE